jgi:hypothetical protein
MCINVPNQIANMDADRTTFPSTDANSSLQSSCRDYSQLYELVYRLELVRTVLTIDDGNFEAKSAVFIEVINQAIKDVNLAIDSNSGWSVVRLKVNTDKT